jgi:transposase-like protein
MKKIPPETRAAIVSRRRREGLTHVALAAEFKVSKFAVGKILRRAQARDQSAAADAANP